MTKVASNKKIKQSSRFTGSNDLSTPISKTEVLEKIGTSIIFNQDTIYGSTSIPETGNIVLGNSPSLPGVTILIIHNASGVPTLPASFKKVSTSGSYVNSVINYIICTFLDPTTILYSISQAS